MKFKHSKGNKSPEPIQIGEPIIELPESISKEATDRDSHGEDSAETDGSNEGSSTRSRPQMEPPEEVISSVLGASTAEEHPNAFDLQSPKDVTNRLRKRFGFFLAVGTVVILVLDPLYGAPAVGVMLVYFFTTQSLARRPTTREVFADSIYYMGFLFTFIALFATIGPLASEQDLSSQIVIGKLGIALSTTVFGMAIRVMLTHFDQILTAPEEDMRDTLAEMGAKLHDELHKSITAIRDFRRETLKEISGLDEKIAKGIIERLERILNDMSDRLTVAINRIDDASSQFHGKINAIDLSPGILRDRVGAAFSEVDKEVPKLAEAIAQTANEADKLCHEVGRIGNDMNAAANALSQLTSESESLSGLAGAAAEGEGALKELNSTISQFKAVISDIERRSQAAYDEQIKELSDATKAVSANIADTRRALVDTTREAEDMRASLEGAVSDVLTFLRKELKR